MSLGAYTAERPWALHETPVAGDRDGYESPDPPPEDVERAQVEGGGEL
jgi:hypothetical protein